MPSERKPALSDVALAILISAGVGVALFIAPLVLIMATYLRMGIRAGFLQWYYVLPASLFIFVFAMGVLYFPLSLVLARRNLWSERTAILLGAGLTIFIYYALTLFRPMSSGSWSMSDTLTLLVFPLWMAIVGAVMGFMFWRTAYRR
jgi:hypothetical protein